MTDLLRQQLGELSEYFCEKSTGLFITFEGGDGSGKTTQLRLLGEDLLSRGAPVLVTREPGGTDLGQELRRLVMHGPDDVDPRTEALLYAADRSYHVANIIRPALEAGTTVLDDRYIDSSVAYQGAARSLGTDEIRGLSEWATQGLAPHVTLLYDLEPQVALARFETSFDRLEKAGDNFHQRVREQYVLLVEQYPERIRLIDADRSIDDVYLDTVRILWEALIGNPVSPTQTIKGGQP